MADLNMTTSSDAALAKIRSLEEELRKARQLVAAVASKEADIFGLFKRLHKDEFSGTGLGLAICQRIVERYSGQIRAEGRPGRGATFHIVLPGAEL